MGGASTGLHKWISLSFACDSGNGEGMDMERRVFFRMKKGGLEAGRGSGKESFRPGTENKKPLTEMSP